MSGKWIRCPHCKAGHPYRFTICSGNQYEVCPDCDRRFLLVIENWRLIEVRALHGW